MSLNLVRDQDLVLKKEEKMALITNLLPDGFCKSEYIG